MKERVGVFIDGSNLYYKLRSCDIDQSNLSGFNYLGLCEWLALNRKIAYKGYYIGSVRAKLDDKKGQKLRRNQIQLFNHLNFSGFVVKKGYLMESGGKFHEKGVDVQLAVDILVGAYEDKYDTAILISSDTDLIPAIRKVKDLNKKIEYIGFSHQPSFGLQKHADISRLLIKQDLEKFVSKKTK